MPSLQAWKANNPSHADGPSHVVMSIADYFLIAAELSGSTQDQGALGHLLTVYGVAIMIDPSLGPGRFMFYVDRKKPTLRRPIIT